MERLNWFEVSTLDDGVNYGESAQAVVFATDYWKNPDCVVPKGTRATVSCNGLNELSCMLEVKLDDKQPDLSEADVKKLRSWFPDGYIFFMHDLDPGADVHGPAEERDEAAREWFKLSPLGVEELAPYYCTGCGHKTTDVWSVHRVRCIGECPQTPYPPKLPEGR